MFAIITAAGLDKETVIKGLKQAVLDLENESANNFIETVAGCDVEADIFDCDFKYMAKFLKLKELRK